MAKNDGPTHVAYRSSVTGNFVTEGFAHKHPDTTYVDTLPDNGPIEHNDDHEDEAAHEAKAAEESDS